MKKVIIAGAFDCLAQKDIHLIKEAMKLAVGGELFAIIYGDHQHYKDFGYFPIQSAFLRTENLKYFIRSKNIILRGDFLKNISQAYFIGDDDTILFVHPSDDKDFPGRDDLKEANITIKFIKPYGKA